MPSIDRPSATDDIGLKSFINGPLGQIIPIGDATALHNALMDSRRIDAGPDGYVVAQVNRTADGIVMQRRDPDDELSVHHLKIGDTPEDAERLLAHWRGFCEVALKDHEERRAKVATPRI